MNISAILFGAGLALLAGVFIARPFLERSAQLAAGRQSSPRQELLAQKAANFAAIREIDADVQVGKLEPADHRTLRQRYVAEGVAVLKALDSLPAGDAVEAAIEADVARLLAGERPVPAGGAFCPSCGAPADPRDKFCARCGARIEG